MSRVCSHSLPLLPLETLIIEPLVPVISPNPTIETTALPTPKSQPLGIAAAPPDAPTQLETTAILTTLSITTVKTRTLPIVGTETGILSRFAFASPETALTVTTAVVRVQVETTVLLTAVSITAVKTQALPALKTESGETELLFPSFHEKRSG